ncbi:MAG: hypothetical protein AB7E77_11420, partial [Desulfobulbus sp.]
MDLETLKERFYEIVAPSIPNEWDVEEALEPLATDEAEYVEDIFSQIPAIWPVSHALCFSYLKAAGPALCCLAQEELSLWVHSLLDRYETGGLRAAQLFMEDVEQQFACHRRGQGGLRLLDIRGRLQPYVNGLAGRELPLITADAPSTDGESIYLPGEIGLFPEQEENFLLYKLMASFQWACLQAGTFSAPDYLSRRKKGAHPLDCFFSEFLNPANARCLYHFFETGRILRYLRSELPGLIRQATPLLERLVIDDQADQATLLTRLQQGLLHDTWLEPGVSKVDDEARRLMRICQEDCAGNTASLEAVRELIPLMDPDENLEQTVPLVFQGKLRLQEMRNLGLRAKMDKEMRMMQSVHLPPVLKPQQGAQEGGNSGGQQGQDAAVIIDPETALEQLPPFMHSQMNIESALPIETGEEPSPQQGQSATTENTVSATEGRGGQIFAKSTQGGGRDGKENIEPIVYDEWDYRRKGFRKNWCVVTEKEIQPVHNAFMEQTLKQYRGQIRRLRHQFER